MAFAALVSTPTFAQTEVIIRQAPPAERVEVIPAERPGYAWDRGHWKWQRGAYAWVPGHWQPVMRNAVGNLGIGNPWPELVLARRPLGPLKFDP